MRATPYERTFLTWSAFAILLVLALIPFHATLTVSLAQFIGHYTLLRLWKELVLALLVVAAVCVSVRRRDVRQEVLTSKLSWAIGAFIGVHVLWAIVAIVGHQVTPFALGYGLITDTRFLIFFLAVWTLALAGADLYRHWPRVVFWPAAVVVAFGLLQYFVLPYNFMEHVGYSAATIFPYEDINHNVHYIRVISTLRGANPLGAYLVAVLTLLGAQFMRQARLWYRVTVASRLGWIALGLASVVVLVLSFSRGAWLGALASLACLFAPVYWRTRTRSTTLLSLAAALLVCVGGAVVLRQSPTFQNVFLHTESDSIIKTTSNAAHLSALEVGLSQTIHEPLGRGPGTAGPASVYNAGHSARIAENYYIQVAQETGWLGIALFAAINVLVGIELWRHRQDTLACGLLAALIGLVVVNLFSHAWADDTLAYFWWGLAAIARARPLVDRRPPAH